jgi:Zn-dependent protease
MKWSWKIGEYKGIGVYVHATFLLIIIWVAYSHWNAGQSLAATITGILFVLAIFGCVVLHEFGHALTAQKYNIKTRDITLLPIGGVARLERMPDDPRQELWVALAGPVVNVVIAIAIFAWLIVTSALEPVTSLTVTSGSFLERLMVVNIFLVVFNMLPAFPMDGGRVVRALLALRMEYARATHIAANLGQAMALLFGFVGFFTNPFLIFIALFVWIGAQQEASMAQVKTAFDGIPVSHAMLTDFYTLNSNDTLARAVQLILAGSQHDFPVLENGHVVGVLTRSDLMKALAEHGQSYPVSGVMRQDFEMADTSEMLQTAFTRLQGCDCRIMPVLKEDKLVGLLNMENVGEFIMINSALRKAAKTTMRESYN